MTDQTHKIHLMILEIAEKHGITEMYNNIDTETRKHFFQFVGAIYRTNVIKDSMTPYETMIIAYIVGYDRGCNSPPSTQFGI